MSKFPYQPHKDILVQVAVCSVNSFLKINPFSVDLNEVNLAKINTVLENSIDSKFILFPEYTYSSELQELYRDYSNQNNCIIIGGSGLESFGTKYYAYAPVFIPNQDLIKVYKRRITPIETVLSGGKIIDYPDKVQRHIEVSISDETDVRISVYVCYDFFVENKTEQRSDIIFVPQYEPSPQSFISEAEKTSKGWDNFVLGANNSNDNQRSVGFVPNLNDQIINGLALREWRDERYPSDGRKNLDREHYRISFDITGEKLITFNLNVGNPVADISTFSYVSNQPNFIPLNKIDL